MLIQRDNLYCKGIKGGWKKSTDIDLTSLPKRCVAIEIEEDGERFLCVHHLTQYEPSDAHAKVVCKKLKRSDENPEIWVSAFTRTEIYDQYSYDGVVMSENSILTEEGLRSLLVDFFVQ